jgi:phosphoglycolate phosphatase
MSFSKKSRHSDSIANCGKVKFNLDAILAVFGRVNSIDLWQIFGNLWLSKTAGRCRRSKRSENRTQGVTTLITILFDIDGTLVKSGGAGMIAIAQAMRDLFGLTRVPQVDVHGRTDNGILGDIFEHESLSYDQHREEFNKRYWSALPDTLAQCAGTILPGVENLLRQLSRQENVALGLLTGNSNRAAEIKLRHFGLHNFFDFGGYGDFHSNRNDVAALARQSAERSLGRDFDETNLWVVGDTVDDIVCARWIDARVVAVETGGGEAEKLNSANPDCQLASLADAEAFLHATVGEMGKELP